MSRLRCLCAALLVAGLTLAVAAQDPPPAAPVLAGPPPPPAMAPPSPLPVGINSYPAPPGPPTVWSYMGIDAQQREYRQLQQARTPFGEFREKLQNPLSKLTGGLIKPFPPLAATQALLKDPGPIGAAAKIKLDKAAAPDRVKAIGELSKVDCYYWPEAEDALVGALRMDRNMSVRLAAAQALGSGCCCTKKTIAALSIAASCSDADGNPAEKCPEVVAAAQASLTACLQRVCACVAADPVQTDPDKPRTDPTTTPMAGWSKPGPAGYEKSSGGLPYTATARPTGKEYYDRIANRRWADLIPPAQAIAARTPQIPASLMLSGTGPEFGSNSEAVTGLRGRPREPETLLDLLTGTSEPQMASSTPSWGRMGNLFDRFLGSSEPPPAYTSFVTEAPQTVATPSRPMPVPTAAPQATQMPPRPMPVPTAAPTTPRPVASTNWAPSPANAKPPTPATAPALFTQPVPAPPTKTEPAPAKPEPPKPAATIPPPIIPAAAVVPAPAATPPMLPMSDNPLPPLALPKPTLPTPESKPAG